MIPEHPRGWGAKARTAVHTFNVIENQYSILEVHGTTGGGTGRPVQQGKSNAFEACRHKGQVGWSAPSRLECQIFALENRFILRSVCISLPPLHVIDFLFVLGIRRSAQVSLGCAMSSLQGRRTEAITDASHLALYLYFLAASQVLLRVIYVY